MSIAEANFGRYVAYCAWQTTIMQNGAFWRWDNGAIICVKIEFLYTHGVAHQLS